MTKSIKMKFNINQLLSLTIITILLAACGDNGGKNDQHGQENSGQGHHDDENVHLSAAQFEAMEMEVDTLQLKNLSSVVQANGQLEVPPQNEAIVTAIIGANVSSIQ